MLHRSTTFDLIEDLQPVSVASRPMRGSRKARRTVQVQDAPACTPYDTVQQTLHDIQRSAATVVGAGQGFLLVCRDDRSFEVASTFNLGPQQALSIALSQAAAPLHAALKDKLLATGDLHGDCPTLPADAFGILPAALCVPLDLGPRMSGVLCLLRRGQPQHMSDLDVEIVQALAEQAALAICAARHSTALSRLQASLSTLAPAYA